MPKRFLIAIPFASLLLFAGFWNPGVGVTEYDSTRWIDSGLEHERSGDLAGAGRDLLEAAKVDHLFQPRWTLAGFYFRRGDTEHFWLWTRGALAVGRRDLGALFDLCWQVTGDDREIWARAMPDRKPTWNEYLFYLMTAGKWPAAAQTASRIAAAADPGDKPLLMNYCDLALEHGDRAGSFAVWKAIFRRDRLLTNGDFGNAPSGRGFDWRAPKNPGVTASFLGGEAKFVLSGFEPEHAVLLMQPLVLDPAKEYRLDFEATSAVAGVHWEAGGVKSNGLRSGFEFPGSAQSLALVYQRPPGSVIAEGTVVIRHLDVTAK